MCACVLPSSVHKVRTTWFMNNHVVQVVLDFLDRLTILCAENSAFKPTYERYMMLVVHSHQWLIKYTSVIAGIWLITIILGRKSLC